MNEPKTEEEINAEKAAKPRPDLIPGSALLAMGAVMAYGWNKHGDCTWKTAGTEQADPRTHIASAVRHLAEYLDDADAAEEGSGLSVLWHAASQLAIAIDCIDREATRRGEEVEPAANEGPERADLLAQIEAATKREDRSRPAPKSSVVETPSGRYLARGYGCRVSFPDEEQAVCYTWRCHDLTVRGAA